MNDFLIAGGTFETREFHSPQEVASVPQPVIINCPGYGGRQLWADESIIPVRGQSAWLIPQEGAHYGLIYKDLNVVARRDGIVVQPIPGGRFQRRQRTAQSASRRGQGSAAQRSCSTAWRPCGAADGARHC